MKTSILLLLGGALLLGCHRAGPATGASGRPSAAIRDFPDELVRFTAHPGNPVFAGTNAATWDHQIRERGYILKEGTTYHLWYTGYRKGADDDAKYLGYASSPDGLTWTRYAHNPIHTTNWVEDMCVVKSGDLYYMFAESRDDIARLLTSTDRLHWQDQGSLNIRSTNGQPISKGPYGTPTVWKEGRTWYLFYERNDAAVWLATSEDLKSWTNVQDEPVLRAGPERYDGFGVAMNQIIRHQGLYYGYYHGTAFKDWREWSTNVAVSKDLIHWTKYPRNPIMGDNTSSGILVHDGSRYRLYTMHPAVRVYFPASGETPK